MTTYILSSNILLRIMILLDDGRAIFHRLRFVCRFQLGEQQRRTDTVDGQAIRWFNSEIRVRRWRRAGRLSATRPAASVIGHHGGNSAVAPPADNNATTATTRTAAEEFSGDSRRQFSGNSFTVYIGIVLVDDDDNDDYHHHNNS